MASGSSRGNGHTLLPQLFSHSALVRLSDQLRPRERFFLEVATSWESQRPAKVAGHRRHVMSWIQKPIYTLLPAYVHIALTLSR